MRCPKCDNDCFEVTKNQVQYKLDQFYCVMVRSRRCVHCGYAQRTTESIEYIPKSTGSHNHIAFQE